MSDEKSTMSDEKFSATTNLRFVRRVEGPVMKRILQQAWQNLETYEIEWRDVPEVVDNEN